MKFITQITPWAFGLSLALGLVGGSPVLAQPAGGASGSTGESSAWKFDAGVSKVPGLRFGWGTESGTAGAWFGAGTEHLGLSVDYWHAEEYKKGDKYTPGWVETAIADQIDIAGVWRFGRDRVLSPYVLAGVGFERSRYHSCWDTRIGRRCSGTSASREDRDGHRRRRAFLAYARFHVARRRAPTDTNVLRGRETRASVATRRHVELRGAGRSDRSVESTLRPWVASCTRATLVGVPAGPLLRSAFVARIPDAIGAAIPPDSDPERRFPTATSMPQRKHRDRSCGLARGGPDPAAPSVR